MPPQPPVLEAATLRMSTLENALLGSRPPLVRMKEEEFHQLCKVLSSHEAMIAARGWRKLVRIFAWFLPVVWFLVRSRGPSTISDVNIFLPLELAKVAEEENAVVVSITKK